MSQTRYYFIALIVMLVIYAASLTAASQPLADTMAMLKQHKAELEQALP